MENIQKLDYISGYEKYLYTGISGLLMKRNHKILSKNVPEKLNKKILEIGGGASPHFNHTKLIGVNEYWISDNENLLNEKNLNYNSKFSFKINYHKADSDPNYDEFFKKEIKFSRIVASHVWEHLNYPEVKFLKWMSLLENYGRLDIAIPCDPGILFRLGQLIGRKKAIDNYNMSFKEIELMLSREHINSAQNLMRIVNYYTFTKPSYFPFRLHSINLNLFIFLKIYKSEFKPLN